MPKTLMQSIANQLQKERTRLEGELHRVTAALTAFGKVYLEGSKAKAIIASRKKRTISAAGRKKIAAAQRARWAVLKAAKTKKVKVGRT
jgi:hypothetical protein